MNEYERGVIFRFGPGHAQAQRHPDSITVFWRVDSMMCVDLTVSVP